MKAAYYERQGQARDVLLIGEMADPVAGPNEVRVRIEVSGLNPSDIKARSGFSAPMAYPLVIPQQDGAGIIDAVGEGVSPERIGERVWVYEAQQGSPFGTAAQFVVIPEHKAVALPDGVALEVGASLGVPALTAHRCLFSDGSLKGKRVLVHGGAGAVGTAAILLAKWAGAWVATTVSNASQGAVAVAAGADLVIDRHQQSTSDFVLRATQDQGVDRIVDVDLLANLTTNLKCVAQGGVVSSYAMARATDEVSVPMLEAMKRGCVFRFVFVYNIAQEDKRSAIMDISACLAAKAYLPAIGKRFDLNDIVAAHEAMESSRVIGKIIVNV